jgi:hypothetical protein
MHLSSWVAFWSVIMANGRLAAAAAAPNVPNRRERGEIFVRFVAVQESRGPMEGFRDVQAPNLLVLDEAIVRFQEALS